MYLCSMKARYYNKTIKDKSQSKWGRILVIIGARQTGKTTLIKNSLPDYTYISIEDPQMRVQYKGLTAQQWHAFYPKAALDEIQKEPQLMESIKSVYDQYEDTRYALLGSSQLLLMKQVKESLAGRCIITDLYPLTLPELETESWDAEVKDSPFQIILKNNTLPCFYPSSDMIPDIPAKQKAWFHYTMFGGYPAVSGDCLQHWLGHAWSDNS